VCLEPELTHPGLSASQAETVVELARERVAVNII
jgi:hypothetical protein